MQIVIDIPEEEFGIDINDKFKDFFSRLKVEIKQHLMTNTSLVCGAYELEIIDMFLKAFNNGTPLPKGHGGLIDRSKIYKAIPAEEDNCTGMGMTIEEMDAYNDGIDAMYMLVKGAKPIIEADTSGKEIER